jgi:hypothetical protein
MGRRGEGPATLGDVTVVALAVVLVLGDLRAVQIAVPVL